MPSKIFKSDIGTVVEIDVGEDTSSATKKEFHMVKPSGDKDIVTCTTVSGSNNKISFTASSDHWTETGVYICQAYLEYGTDRYWGEIVKLTIHNPEGDATP
jgi:hypothetical protein